MVANGQKPGWRVIGRSIRGASHQRAGLPNQDAIDWLPQPGDELPLILALSDGHGSARSFRSDEGARLAVSQATSSLQTFLSSQSDLSDLKAIRLMAEQRLPRMLVEEWRRSVNEQMEKRPISSLELSTLEKKMGAVARHAVEENMLVAYGATLLAAIVTGSFII